MALNVIMIGASRSGKTSILASMLNNVRDCRSESKVNNYFFVDDRTDYDGLEPEMLCKVDLQENIDGMKDMLKVQVDGHYVPKMAALMGTQDNFRYKMDVNYKLNGIKSGKTLSIVFNDIPGENCTDRNYALIEDEVKKSQILIVAVDVPSLMYAKESGLESLNTVMNCTNAVYNALQDLGTGCYDEISNESERNQKLVELLRMVIFVPIKCEYWMQNGQMDDVIDEIKRVYDRELEVCRNFENIQAMVLPIETIGTCLFDHFSDEGNSMILKYGIPPTSKNYVAEDVIEGKKTVRCEQIAEGQVRLKNGVIYDLRPEDELIRAKERQVHPYCYDRGKLIPYTWFKANSKKIEPKYCELLFCRVLKFSIMDLAKRTGHSPREAFDDANNWWQRICRIPNFLGRFFSGERAAYSDVEQARNFQRNIREIERQGVLDENHITYLVNKENGVVIL